MGDRWVSYWRIGKSATENKSLKIQKRYASCVEFWARKHSAGVPPASSNPRGGAHVTEDTLVNQKLQTDLPVKEEEGSSG